MNRIFTAFCSLTVLILSGTGSIAQHKATLWGLSEVGGPQNKGYIFKYDVAANTLSKEIWLNKTNSEPMYYPDVFKVDSDYLYAVKGQNDSVDKATIVRYDRKSGKLETLYTFNDANYKMVSGSLTEFNGRYYGLASAYSINYNHYQGCIFELNLVTNAVIIRQVLNYTNGQGPWGQLFRHNNKLYGITAYGGANSVGVLFEYDPVANTYTKKAEFANGTTGGTPDGYLQLFNNKFYGVCLTGGAESKGTIFEYDLATAQLRKVHDLKAKTVWGKPALHNGHLYIPQAEYYSFLEYNITANTYKAHYPSVPNDFISPSSPLTLYNGALYGMSSHYALTDSIFIFKWIPGATEAEKLVSYSMEKEGKDLRTTMTVMDNKFFAVTTRGGQYGRGSLLEIDPVAKTSLVKAHFGSGIDGYSTNFYSSNLINVNNRLYGTASNGGHYGNGLLFSFDPATRNYERLHDFNLEEPTSWFPNGDLIASGEQAIQGLVGWSYNYLRPYTYRIQDKKIDIQNTENESSALYFKHGIDQPYASYGTKIYKATQADGTLLSGIDMSTYNYNGPKWTRVFTFPIPVWINWERGLTVYKNKLIGPADLRVNGQSKGIIYMLDLDTYEFSWKMLDRTSSGSPKGLTGIPVELNNRLYVLTGSGCLNNGSLIEWDNTQDTAREYCIENVGVTGHLLGTMTVVDGKLYGYTTKGIFSFDPATKAFKETYRAATPFFEYGHYSTREQLALVYSNTVPQIAAVDSINFCEDEPLTRTIPLSVSDADGDTLQVTASYTDTFLIRSCRVKVDTAGNGSLNWSLQVEANKVIQDATITLTVADPYLGSATKKIRLAVGIKWPVSIAWNTDTICRNDTSVLITGGRPGGGLYLVDGQPVDTTKGGLLPVGLHTLKYIYTSRYGCVDSASRSFYVADCDPQDTTVTAPPGDEVVPYPNPSPGYAKVVNEDQLSTTVHVFNSQGFKVYTKVSSDKIIVLDLSHLRNGLYYLTTINAKGVGSGKVELMK